MGCGASRPPVKIVGADNTAGAAEPKTTVPPLPSKAEAKSNAATKKTAALRIIQITDVYTLENFPSLKTLIQEKRAEFEAAHGPQSKTVSMLTGDFLMPYLLSTVDQGRGMMSMLNETPIDYVTWGNHEADLAHADVCAREKEYKGVWINSNMQSHDTFAGSTCQTDAAWIDVSSSDASHARKVAMIGVLTNVCNKKTDFGGAGGRIGDPWECMTAFKAKLEGEGADVVIPLCHLYEPQDERTANEMDFPLILSGHDHHRVDKIVNGTRILKPGLDGHYAVVVDLLWDDPAASNGTPPSRIEAQTIKVADFMADAVMAATIAKAYTLIDNLRKTQIAVVPPKWRPLTSVDARGKNVSMGSFLCSEMRDALNLHEPTVDCVISALYAQRYAPCESPTAPPAPR